MKEKINRVIKSQNIVCDVLDSAPARFLWWEYEDDDLEQGMDRDSELFDRDLKKVSKSFDEAIAIVSDEIGSPAFLGKEWSDTWPHWASGGLYARWNLEDRFVTLFLNHDDRETPLFLVIASADHNYNTDEVCWDYEWMNHEPE